jgi:neogenin
MLDDLRPNTEYEFTVKVINGRRQSKWSMVTTNATQEAAPGSAPRDLVIRRQDQGGLVLSWRSPKFPNGVINGYVIQYTADRRADEREWFVEAIVGDVNSAVIQGWDSPIFLQFFYLFSIFVLNRF